MRDIVFPKGNEKEFIAMALKLGYSRLVFVYDFKSKADCEKVLTAVEKMKSKELDIDVLFLADRKKGMQARKAGAKILCAADEEVRGLFEAVQPVAVYGLEIRDRKDFIHHRNSGLNQIICKIANDNKVGVGFSFSSILRNENNRAVLIGRMMQNIKLCRKYNVNMIIGSFAEKPEEMRAGGDIGALFKVIGMTGGEVKKGLQGKAL